MTPEKALAILEGKVSHREQSRSDYDEKKIKNLPSREMEITRDTDTVNTAKNNDFIRIFIIVLSGVGLVAFHLWRVDAASDKFYKNGFNDGVASLSGNLTSAQKDISDKLLQMDQLQQELSQARQNSELLTRQKDDLAQSLKETQESVPARISAVTRRSDEKIKGLMDGYQKKINDLSGKLDSAQKDIDDKEKQLSGLQKALAQSEQEGNKARKDLNNKLQQLNKLQQDLSRSKQAPAVPAQPPHPTLPAVN